MNKAIGFAFFLTGAAIGAASAWLAAKKKYEEIANEEIESYKLAVKNAGESFSKGVEEQEPDPETAAKVKEKAKTVRDYAKRLAEEGYTNYGEHYVSPEERTLDEENEAVPPEAVPYVISPDEFGSDDTYDKITLLYFDDGVVAESDTLEELSDDEIEMRVGLASLNHFGEYEEDSVKVRNERLRTDFEILMDARLYSKVIARRAKRVEV